MHNHSILIIEDEEDIQQLVSYHLVKAGFHVLCAENGEEGLKIFETEKVDLVILDLMLPGMDGVEVCRQMKQSRAQSIVPVIMLTAKGEEDDMVQGLEAGADDYVAKPFSPKVLVARIKAHLRRDHKLRARFSPSSTCLSLPGGLHVNFEKHEVAIGAEPIDLTISEFNILGLLASKPDMVFTRQQIIDNIRGYGYEVTPRAVDVQIHGLRKKLKSAGKLIETVRGVGYRFRGETG